MGTGLLVDFLGRTEVACFSVLYLVSLSVTFKVDKESLEMVRSFGLFRGFIVVIVGYGCLFFSDLILFFVSRDSLLFL